MKQKILYLVLMFFLSSISHAQSFFDDDENASIKHNSDQSGLIIKETIIDNEAKKSGSNDKKISTNNKNKIKLVEETKKEERSSVNQENIKKARELVNLAVELMSEKYYKLADKKLQEARKYDPNFSIIYCNLAVIDIHMNSIDAAFENLETCFMKGFNKIDMIEKDRDFEVLAKDRRFQALKNRYQ